MSSQIPEPPPSAAHVKADNASLGDLLGDVTRDLSTLMRQEVDLAKAELKQSASKARSGSLMSISATRAEAFLLREGGARTSPEDFSMALKVML